MAIHNYIEQVKEYIQATFNPSDPDKCNVRHTNDSLLLFLSLTFSSGCISDYELTDILLELGYKRHTWEQEHVEERETKTETVTTVHKSITTGWCFFSGLDLKPEVYRVPKSPV